MEDGMHVLSIERDGTTIYDHYGSYEDAWCTAKYWEDDGWTAVIYDEDDDVVYATDKEER